MPLSAYTNDRQPLNGGDGATSQRGTIRAMGRDGCKSQRVADGYLLGVARTYDTGGNIRKVTLGILGAAAAVASLLLIRQTKRLPPKETLDLPAGESIPAHISLDRLRELGI